MVDKRQKILAVAVVVILLAGGLIGLGSLVRNIYADPAFNPYEPENGFADQGRPLLVKG